MIKFFVTFPIFKTKTMKKLTILLLLTIPFGMLNQHVTAQEVASGDSLRDHYITAARELMISTRYCALITIDEDGWPSARTMDAFEPDSELTVWFGTKSGTTKVRQIEQNPETTLYYYDHENWGYVALYGKATIVNDPEAKKRWWKEDWEQFYPDGRKDYILIKFVTEWFRIYSPKHNIEADPETWRPPEIRL